MEFLERKLKTVPFPNHTLHGHNFSNSDLYTFALQAKGSSFTCLLPQSRF